MELLEAILEDFLKSIGGSDESAAISDSLEAAGCADQDDRSNP